MVRILFTLTLIVMPWLMAQEYALGRGATLYATDEMRIKLGAHASLFYHLASKEQNSSVGLDQAGVMLYGKLTPSLRFLGEIGSDDIYSYDLQRSNAQSTPLQLMRLYGDYLFTDALQLKGGQFLTPIGIWNNTYIPALRWSAFTPYVATRFFPKIIVGAALHGRAFKNNAFEYALFYHANGEYDTNKNNVPAQEFVGAELRFHFNTTGKIALPFGRFRSNSYKEICLFTGLNFILPLGKSELSSEFLYKDGKWNEPGLFMNEWKDYAWYAQYVQHVMQSHYISIRYGQKVRFASKNSITWEDNNGVVGYIYRPYTALSYKLEYRKRVRTGQGAINSDEGLATFSVLF